MTTQRKSRQNPAISEFILRNVDSHPLDIGALASKEFGLSRTSINRYIKRLEATALLAGDGKTTARRYRLLPISHVTSKVQITPGLAENEVWSKYIEPHVLGVQKTIADICYYGFSEMFNNVIDHSQSKDAIIDYEQTHSKITILVIDHGVGIFEKIQKDFNLIDQRTALLELSKGKLTSDSEHHSGEGIFFTSRMFETFSLRSGNLFYRKKRQDDWGWLIETEELVKHQIGTAVEMTISTDAVWTIQEVFEKFTAKDDEISFIKTHVPIALGRYGSEQLVSRSQAKRILARFDRFQEVFLDFSSVEIIGQPFADEIFRVFKKQHPETNIIAINTTPEIDRVIAHVTGQSGGLIPEGNP